MSKAKNSITLHPKYGVNPSVQVCPCCGKDMGVILFGNSYIDAQGKHTEAPRQVITRELCDSCKDAIKAGGVFFIEVFDGESGNNPKRTGRVVGIKREAAMKIFKKEVSPISYMEKSLFTKLFDDTFNNNNN